MPWDENDGHTNRNPGGSGSNAAGKSGGGRKNPWGPGGGNENGGNRGTGGGRGGPDQPDLDDILSRMHDGMRDFIPGDFGGGKTILIGIGDLAVLWLASGFYTIGPGEHAVIQRFGAWEKTVDTEGLNYRLPTPIESMSKFNVNEIRTMNIGFSAPATGARTAANGRDVPEESLMLTSDFNIVDLDFVVQWNISSAEDFVFNIENPENTLRKVAQSAIR